ncbi:putative GAL4-like Zn(II)2Cys6 (or C6 zinc) binuclear cluster DNA-binding domain [Lyophyllum shimeji]|uniref:GAL4-like Zn(II)2Cys6 (Or C6 zinc) binuclear cluster DNA-binding domain n=1 Tax=Lyophyllum shimeji TaxID=47721 RepID=A0A9P3UNL9_LYOSH|nr:putative GAL4-like Zn(II)2Cys6 (or C6 zinc) binuclear cluster DNA-binding domain [Lyophyllum shimeji]
MMRAQSTDVRPPDINIGRKSLMLQRWTSKARSPEESIRSNFSPGYDLETPLSPPDIVKHCALYAEEIDYLFKIFFERVNPFFSILDPELHIPEKLIWTCPFLFTVICAVSSRYYEERPSLYLPAMEFARDAAGRALIDGSKSVDVCQAYLLMAVYPVPKKKWAEDRSWLLKGVAIRMAIELELNQPPPTTCSERERLNRTRTWLNCYYVDGSHAIQFGKMPMLRLDDYLASHSGEWYKSSSMNLPFDVHLCAYVHIIIIVARWRSIMADDQKAADFDVVASVLGTEAELSREMALWVELYAEEFSRLSLPICAYRGNTTQMITAYLRLVVLAVGFQHAAKLGFTRDSELVSKSVQAARAVIHIMAERLYPTGNLRFAMEANFLYVSFAAAFLMNLLRPKLLPLLDEELQEGIIQDVSGLIDILGSKAVALDGRHTPALCSRFLSSLLAKHNSKPPRATVQSSSSPNEPRFYAQYSDDRQPTPPHSYSWPDVMHAEDVSASGRYTEESAAEGGFYQYNDADMDLSSSHFVQTVTQGFPMCSHPAPEHVSIFTNGSNWDFPDTPATQSLQDGDSWRM